MREETRWLTSQEAAEYLQVHQETVRNWARKGVIPAAKLGNRGGFRFRREDLDRLLESRCQPGPREREGCALVLLHCRRSRSDVNGA